MFCTVVLFHLVFLVIAGYVFWAPDFHSSQKFSHENKVVIYSTIQNLNRK